MSIAGHAQGAPPNGVVRAAWPGHPFTSLNLVPLDADTSELPTYAGEQLNQPQASP
ncbi:hypothetical protein [Subtercola endophyticus]|uniref:hypothetical protein n=1 Tax=Subtercola endophyticus TaxID=2895559 RepID=UPI001E45F5E4|nr:hypothetical protein [Subtercola endophyticus]UFS57598.1 hypothetical protein LQ955_11050 [Subtercola endophyticus]